MNSSAIKASSAIEDAVKELKKVDKYIKKQYRYTCGIERLDAFTSTDGNIGYRGFFLSPDYQNSDLFYALIEEGWGHSKYTAPYFWRLHKNGITISYSEGDISVYEKA